MSEPLKSCPFCGGEAEIERHGDRRQSTVVKCTECGCRLEGPEEFDHGGQWNKRKAEGELLAALKGLVEAADYSYLDRGIGSGTPEGKRLLVARDLVWRLTGEGKTNA